MALKDLKSDLGKFRTVIKPDGKAPDPPKPLDFGKYTPISDVASSYKNSKKFSTRSILSFERPKTELIDETDLIKFESEYDNDSIKKYNPSSKLQNEAVTIKNKPSISGNNEKSNVTPVRANISGNNEDSLINVASVETKGNNELSPINPIPVKTSGNNEKTQFQIPKIKIQGNNESSNIRPTLMDLSSRHLTDNSALNLNSILNSIPDGRHETDNSNLNLDGKINQYEIRSRLIKLNSNFNIDDKPEITMAGGRYEKPKKSNYGFLKDAPSVNFFSNTFFTGFDQKQTDTAYTGETSIYSWAGNRKQAPSTNFFSNTNVKSGFDTFAKLGDSKYLFNSSYGSIGAVDFFKNVNVSDGFTINAKLYESKFLNNSIYGVINNVNVFSDKFALGFTPKFKLTQFTDEAFNYGFKGSIPSVDFFANRNVTQGFHRFAQLGDTKYITDSSVFTWKGGPKSAPSTNFFLDTNASGFTKFQNTTAYIIDSSIHTWKGGSANAPETNFFSNTNTISGFTKFAFGQPTQFKIDSSKFTWVGGRTNAPAVDFFLNTNRDGFKTFNKLYESYYKTDSTSLHEIATTPNELARTGGGTYKLNNQLIKSPLFNNIGFSKQSGTYSETLKLKQFNSILGETANKRNSPSLLDLQYNKYDLTNDSFNVDYKKQPYILRGIQKQGSVENERWGSAITIADGLIRGGAMTALNRTIEDVKRITNFMISAKGIGFITKQIGLHLSSQNQETDPIGAALNLGFNPVKIYNPLAQLLSVAGSPLGLHFTRHGLIPILSNARYESAVKYRNENDTESFKTIRENILSSVTPFAGYQNRLLQLTKELLYPLTDGGTLLGSTPDSQRSSLFSLQYKSPSYLKYYNFNNINRLSYLTGPNSLYGIGATFATRATNTIPLNGTVQLYGHNIMYAPEYAHDHINRIVSKPPRVGTPDGVKTERFTGVGTTSDFTSTFQLDKLYYLMLKVANGGGLYITDDPTRIKDDDPARSQTSILLRFKEENPMWAQIRSPFSRRHVHNTTPPLRLKKLGTSFNKRPDSNTSTDRLHISVNTTSNLNNNQREGQTINIEQLLMRTYVTTDPIIYNQVYNGRLPEDSPVRKFAQAKIKDFRWLLGSVDTDSSGNGQVKLQVQRVNDYPIQSKTNQPLRAVFTNPQIADYDNNNLSDRFGFGEHGKVGLYRDNPTRTHRSTIDTNGQPLKQSNRFIGDRVQLIDFKRSTDTENILSLYELDGSNKYGFDGSEDLIEFYVTGPLEKDRAIVFRATINDIQDNFNPTYNTIKYLGRADPIYLYSAFERSVSVSFQIAVTSRDELRSRWRSINALAAYTAPEYLQSGRMRAPLMKLTLGNLFRQTPVFINSLNYSFDNSQTTWETAKLRYDNIGYETTEEQQYLENNDNSVIDPGKHGVLQLPKFINVKMDLKIIGNYRPQLNGDRDGSPDMGIMYNLYQTTDGRLPRDGKDGNVRVNYFSDTVRVNTEPPVKQEKQPPKEPNKNSTSPTTTPATPPPPGRTDAGTTATQSTEPKINSKYPNAVQVGEFRMGDYCAGKPLPVGYTFLMWRDSRTVVLASDQLAAVHPDYFVRWSPPESYPILAFEDNAELDFYAERYSNHAVKMFGLVQ